MELKEKLKKITPELLKRLKDTHRRQCNSYGYDDVRTYKELNEFEFLPWELDKKIEHNRELYRKFRAFQGEEDVKGYLSVLQFIVKSGVVITICDEKVMKFVRSSGRRGI